MKRFVSIITLIGGLLVLMSCKQQNVDQKLLSNLLDSYLQNLDGLAKMNQKSLIHQPASFVYYIDSTVCYSCRALGWDKFISMMNDSLGTTVQSMLIISPGCSKNIEKRISTLQLKYDIYIDYNNIFKNSNHLPENDIYRVMLIDEKCRIICVGNPLTRNSMKQLYIKILKEIYNTSNEAFENATIIN